jgi:diguanylate cyclase (GGDEF)-like protein
MIKLLARIGRFNTVAIITLIAAAASLAVTCGAVILLNSHGYDLRLNVAVAFAAGVPLVVAPPIGWVLVGLTLKIYRVEEEMRSLASYDTLTGLLNQAAFSVMIIDLDHFKSINDQYGHPAGDAVLRLFADVVNSVARRSDLVGRLGGEEFGIILPSTRLAEALEFSERLQGEIGKAVLKYRGFFIQYTVSIGLVSSSPDATDNIDDLLAQADQALYQAKRNGRNQMAVFDAADDRLAAS